MQSFFSVKDLYVEVDGKEILKGVNLSVGKGEIGVIMGPNGSGKSTLSLTIMGHPRYRITRGEINFLGNNLIELKPYEKAKLGLFLAFQYPYEIEGVPLGRFLWRAVSILKEGNNSEDFPSNPGDFNEELKDYFNRLALDDSFRNRDLNLGFSGGEKKRAEIVQLLTLKPKLSVLDEIDSGLDVDSVKLVASAISSEKKKGKSFLIITHYQRILQYLKPDKVFVMIDGKIVKSGGWDLVQEVEKQGYEHLRDRK